MRAAYLDGCTPEASDKRLKRFRRKALYDSHGTAFHTRTHGVRYGLFFCDATGRGVDLECLHAALRAELFSFLERALGLLDVYGDAKLQHLVREYATLLAKGSRKGAKTSVGIELVWRTHLLSPLRYVNACMVHHAQLVEHGPMYEYADDDPCAASGCTSLFGGSLDWLGFDLVAAMRR